LIQAAAFTLGCAGIHSLRRHARLVTFVLAGTAMTLFLLLVVGGLALEAEREARQGYPIFDDSSLTAEP
jgi:hypothetical protein